MDKRYYGHIDTQGDVDWYRWNLPASGTFTAILEVPSGKDYDLKVYSSCNNLLCTSDRRSGDDEECSVDADSGWIYAKLYGYKGSYSSTEKYYVKGIFEENEEYDLVHYKFQVTPSSPNDEEPMSFKYSFINEGSYSFSEPVSSDFYVDGSLRNTCIADRGLDYLEYKNCYINDLSLDSGSHSLKHEIDPNNDIPEINEGNNVWNGNLFVEQASDYDLTITRYYTIPGQPDDRTYFDFKWEVKNVGDDDIEDLFYSRITYEGELKDLCLIDGLDSGDVEVCVLSHEKWPAGTHWGVLEADPFDSISESDEGNNGADWEIVVKHVPDVDLSVSSIYAEPANVNEKTTFTLKYDVKNSGSEAVDKPFKSQLYINSSLKGTCDHNSGLASGQVQSCGVSNQKWQIGSYSVRAVADVDNAIVETIEGNNELTQPINIADSCVIPDGTSSDCECSSSSDCPSGYYCEFRTGLDACVKVTCNDECNSSGFFCSEGDSYECGSFDSDPCSDKRIVDSCGVGEVCREGERSCLIDPAPVEIHAEDASPGAAVYKQPDDLIEVTMHSEEQQEILFSHPENFTLVSGSCANGAVSVAGDKACLFRINDVIAEGNYYFSAKGKVAKVTVTGSPSTIIVTNKQKLRERFPDDLSGVDSLLKQAFQFASAQGSTVVYYLDREVQGHPFASFGGYSETILAPSLESNAYSMAIAEFVNEKCGQCRNTIILGDDYVVPFYRVDYSTIHSFFAFWISNKTETSSIYSDQPYIKENRKTVGDLSSLFDSNEHKNVKIVIPDSPSAEVQERVEQLKTVLKNRFEYDDREVSVINSGKIGCNSYGTLDKATLVLIGDRDDNNAIKCVPWFDVGRKASDTFKASIEVERNVWANNEYAVVVSGPDLESGLDNLIAVLNYSDYFEGTLLGSKSHVYIHDFSNPPDLPPDLAETGNHIMGFALGTCEEGNFAGEKGACIATDMVAGVVPPTDIITDIRDTVLYCPAFIWNKVTKKKAPILDGLACGGSAAGTGITIGKYVTAVTGVGAVAGTVADAGSTVLKTVLKVTRASLKSGADRMIRVFDKIQLFKFKNAQAFFKAGDDESTWGSVTRFARVTSENSKYINKLTLHFSEEAIAASLKNVDDYHDVAKGTKVVMGSYLNGLDDFHKALPEVERLRLIKTAGRYVDDVIEKYTHVAYKPGPDFLFRGKLKSKVPIKIINGEKKIDWDVVNQGYTGINKASVDLDFIKKLPEKEKGTYAKLSTSHLGNSKDVFISTSKNPAVAAEKFAFDVSEAEGYVFMINPRAGNALDVNPTIAKQFEKGEISSGDYKQFKEFYENEDEVALIEKAAGEDFLGVVKVAKGKIIKDSLEINPKYLTADFDAELEIVKKVTGV